MGWCSATEIFDDVCAAILEGGDKKRTLGRLIDALENADWDCQQDSAYWDNPIVRELFVARHPHWFDEKA